MFKEASPAGKHKRWKKLHAALAPSFSISRNGGNLLFLSENNATGKYSGGTAYKAPWFPLSEDDFSCDHL